jgi:hypothetical protein
MILEQKFPVSASASYWGKLYIPDDYATTNEQHPLIIFCHGVGERGSTKDSLPALDAFGPLKFVKEGSKMEFNNPVDGKQHRFIVLALQDPDWSPSAAEVGYCLLNHIFTNYRINRNCVVVTGLSAGGDSTLKAVTTPGIMELFSAAIPMSPASSGNTGNMAATATLKIKVWGFSGNQDGGFTTNMLAFDAKLNTLAPGSCRTFVYTGGHGGWNDYYNPAYKSIAWGSSMNLYEFCLASMKGSTWVPAPPPSTTVKADFDLTDGAVIKSTSVTVSAAASQNVRTDWQGYLWGLQPTKGGSWGATPKDGAYGGPVKDMVKLTDGQYQLSLTVMDNSGKTNTKAINFTVQTDGVPPPPDPKPEKLLVTTVYATGGTVNVFDDATVEID